MQVRLLLRRVEIKRRIAQRQRQANLESDYCSRLRTPVVESKVGCETMNREMGIRDPRPLQQSYDTGNKWGRSLMVKRAGIRMTTDLNGENRQQGDRLARWCRGAIQRWPFKMAAAQLGSLINCVYHTAPGSRVAVGRTFSSTGSASQRPLREADLTSAPGAHLNSLWPDSSTRAGRFSYELFSPPGSIGCLRMPGASLFHTGAKR